MKKLLLASCMFFYSLTANASVEYSATWKISGTALITQITLDLDVGYEFIAAHGGILYNNGVFVPVTGTCFVNLQGGVQCNVLIGLGRTGILEIGPNLNGEFRVLNNTGFIEDRGTALIFNVIVNSEG